MIETEVYNALTGLGYKVYPLSFPEGSDFPVLIYSAVSTVKKQAINDKEFYGEYKSFRADIFARSYKKAKTIAESACLALKDIGARDFSITELYESEVKLYRQIIDFNIKQI